VWASGGTKAPVGVLSARLKQITVQDYSKSALAKMIQDMGLEFHGLYTDMSEAGSAFIGLEENTAGKNFREAVMAAIQGN
jgi:hypothetical protein